MALDGFHGGRTVGFGVFVGEAGPGCVVACPDGSESCLLDRKACRGV